MPPAARGREALLLDASADEAPEGFRAYLRVEASRGDGPADQPPGARIFAVPPELEYLNESDIVRLTPRSGQVRVLYRRNSRFNYLLTTERCNSNCIMCSQPPKDADDSFLVAEYLAAIPLMSLATPQLCITGGEPALLGDDLLRIIRACKNHLPNTYLHMLSNGRLFSTC
jgi:sulfatase maturation enzyme AslB (radical SAM superfamily)